MSGGGNSAVPETPLQQAQAQVAQQKWADYRQRWLPVQEFYKSRAEGGLPSRFGFATGEANADAQGQFGNAYGLVNTRMSQAGDVAGSNASIFGNVGLAGEQAGAAGLAKTNATDAVTRQYLAGLGDIVAMGRGQQATSDQSLNDLAGLSGQEAAAQAQAAEQDAEIPGTAAGTGFKIGGAYDLSRQG
jgi:hypothetical protein